jgi:hypothetical protein
MGPKTRCKTELGIDTEHTAMTADETADETARDFPAASAMERAVVMLVERVGQAEQAQAQAQAQALELGATRAELAEVNARLESTAAAIGAAMVWIKGRWRYGDPRGVCDCWGSPPRRWAT